MPSATYEQRRGQLEHYFDRTANDAWKRLTSDAPVSGIRATVRAGRDSMRRTLMSWLPTDLRGKRVLDAGCGTGALAVEAARRGAHVIGIDISPKLIAVARERMPRSLGEGGIEFLVGDMLDPAFGRFDHVVAMDSLIHYRAGDMVKVLGGLADRCTASILFTFAPRTLLLSVMHTVGRAFPRGDRAPSIEPVGDVLLHRKIFEHASFTSWQAGRGARVSRGFYISQAMELARK